MLRYVIIFSAHLMMALKVQAQCESPAVGENRIMTEISDQQTFPKGYTVKFKCSTGYIPERTSASRTITCNGNQWSKLQLQCKKKSCGNPGEILNGKYLFPEGIQYGATIMAQCNEGYQLIGDSERNCREKGWDKRHPVCEVVKCINPPSVPDGVFEPEEEVYNYGDGVYYSCKRGLDLFGPSLLTCSNDGTFQPAPPRCLFVTCERPEILHAVRIEGKSAPYKYRDFVRYRCNEGYKMEGSDFLICKEDGWDPPPPQCTIVTCSPPTLIHNGQFNPQKKLYEYGNRVTFRCNEGFKLKGPASSLCTEHGIFHPSPPQCEEIFCDPQTIQNAVIVGNSSLYRYNDSVQIRCNEGYKTVGSDRLTCGVNGWSPGFSPCTVVTCERPEILNAVRIGGKWPPYKYRDFVRYRCNEGYKMEGSDRMICKEDGWDPPPPQCTIVTCSPPTLIHNGQFNPQKKVYEYGNSVKFTCNGGFKLKGSANSSCTEDGIFKPSPPQCEEIFCDPQTIQNAVIVGNSSLYRYNDSVQIRCNEGYKTVGSDRLTCGVNGWSPGFSPCTVVTCERPEILNIVRIEGKSAPYEYRDVVRYRCNEGYKMEGSDRMICKEDGWDPPPPQCTIVTCSPPTLIHNGQFNPQEELYEYGNSVKFTCNKGFKLKGPANSSCTEDGIFKPSPPQCEEIFCDPQTIQNAVIVGISSLYRYNDSFQIRCNEGYKTVGSDRLTCGVNGWIPGFSPCTEICDPQTIQNAVIVGISSLYRYNDSVQIRCNEGYKTVGSDRLTCGVNGWSPGFSPCTEICDPQTIQNAVIVGISSLYRYNDSVQIRCNEGYKTVGSDRLTCGENGWSPGFSPCTVVTCERPEILNVVRIEGKSPPYKYRDFVRYRCNKGYKMEGSDRMICKEDGWDPPPPQCTIVTCLPPTLIHNGQFIFQEELYEYGNSVKFTCNKGFKLKGSANSSCTEYGIFKPSAPQCEVVTCERPEILNAVRIGGKWPPYKYRDFVRYRCNEGYKMEGSDRMICKEDGWDPPPPQCTIVTCLPPTLIHNGQFNPQKKVYEYGNSVKFTCNGGFKLKGSANSLCTEDGIFKPSPPQCEVVTCERPKILNAVRIEGKWPPYKYSDFVSYRCNKGYKMEGSDRIICKEDGWDPPPPQCTIVTCSPPTLIHNGQFNPQKKVYEYGNSVKFTCNGGFKLKGPASSLCTEHGIFEPSPPQCDVVTCERPKILNAYRIGGKWPPYKYRDFVRYRCNEGYKMEGSDRMICKEDGWDPPPPQCTIVTCLPPTLIHNGQFNPQKKVYEYGNSVKFTCNKGFKLKGSASSLCTEDGIFKPSPPQCEEICDPQTIQNAVIVGISSLYRYNDSVKIRCNEGYKTVGSDRLTCGENGWSPGFSPCIVVTCERPEILNAVRIGGKWPPYKYRDFVRYRCNEGYKMEGSDFLICKEDGWDPPPPQCTIVTCSPPPLIHNGQFNPQKELYKYGNRVTFTCNEGFKLKGPASSLCTIDGIFQPSPQCQAQCVRPIIEENRILAETSRQDNFPDGSTLTYKCSTGYVPKQPGSSNSITCKGNQWTELQLQCKLKSCGSPGEIPHGKYLTPDGILFGATATAQCDEGYMLVGERTRNCQDNGWDGRDPVCEVKSCGNPGDISHGKYLTTEGILFGATITAQCDEGYTLVGERTRNCRDDGWDGRDPVCEVVKCINPPSVPDGVFEPEEEVYNYGDGVYYSCKRGLDLFGPSLLTCSNDGTFQPAPPRCLFVTCERPEILNAVRIEGKSPPYKYSDFVRYRCNEGYKMEGSDFLICKEDGWDPPPPQCTKICDPQTIQNAVIVGISSLYRYNDSVQIRCNEGYKTVGSDHLTCGVNGWSPGFSPCTVMTCERPKILNAYRIGGKWPPYKYRDFVRYRCNKGYKMEGSDRMICKEDGWDPPPPQCTIVTCLPPTLIHNGQFNPQKELYEYGNRVTFTCNGGFKLKGPASSLCTEHGIFEPSPPQCEVVTCERPKILNAVRIEGKWPPYKYSDFVRYRCNKGYKMEGSDRIICKEDGWDPPPPQCTIVTCSPPPLIHNGQFNPQKELYKYGNRVTFTCNEGFKLKGPASILCTIDGIFQPSPQCQVVVCSDNGTFPPPPLCSIPDTKLIPVLVNVSSSVPPTEQTTPKTMD
ncbi:hypothetical protein Q7C36_018984 [Tachysurus vachellii]|uniref:Sushi domain-containing protein n=1 Tax=Tachysurus vachellii TaxID=175792 RepID=A0AA88LW73_TACVA|nr:hypothetical protein Q7C36_018984 [Tachysurus vachellii]